ncbi:DNA-binding protein [Pseudomonas sp. MOB-449]|nr:DNA-binding protein [Pseudomonas sp. MOB-449]
MEQSGVTRFSPVAQDTLADFRDPPFCSQLALARMIGIEQITEDVVRGWVESATLPTVKIGRRRVINLHRIRKDLDQGKTVFSAGDYADE